MRFRTCSTPVLIIILGGRQLIGLSKIALPTSNRRNPLTAREVAKIQGFADNFIFYGLDIVQIPRC